MLIFVTHPLLSRVAKLMKWFEMVEYSWADCEYIGSKSSIRLNDWKECGTVSAHLLQCLLQG